MIIPLIGWALAALGAGTLWWYYQLSDEQKRQADRLAAHYAWELFDTTVDRLTDQQARAVHARVRQHFDN
jgi:hypothetical protein